MRKLSKEFGTAAANQRCEIGIVIGEVQKPGRRQKLLPLKEHW